MSPLPTRRASSPWQILVLKLVLDKQPKGSDTNVCADYVGGEVVFSLERSVEAGDELYLDYGWISDPIIPSSHVGSIIPSSHVRSI